jgi:hypothetical protein
VQPSGILQSARTATLVSLLAPGRLFTPQQQLRRLENGA